MPPGKVPHALLNPCNYLLAFSQERKLEDEPPGAAQILVMRQQCWKGSPWGGQGQDGGLGEGSAGARCGSALCDPGQVHLLGGLLLCDRRGLGRCPPKALPSLTFCPQRGRSCCPSRPLLCLLIPCCPSPVSRQGPTAVNLFKVPSKRRTQTITVVTSQPVME